MGKGHPDKAGLAASGRGRAKAAGGAKAVTTIACTLVTLIAPSSFMGACPLCPDLAPPRSWPSPDPLWGPVFGRVTGQVIGRVAVVFCYSLTFLRHPAAVRKLARFSAIRPRAGQCGGRGCGRLSPPPPRRCVPRQKMACGRLVAAGRLGYMMGCRPRAPQARKGRPNGDTTPAKRGISVGWRGFPALSAAVSRPESRLGPAKALCSHVYLLWW